MISIHAPREGSDRCRCGRRRWPRSHFYPRSPRGERPFLVIGCQRDAVISIHAPREGSDSASGPPFFLLEISIHAPREGSDPAVGSG